MSDTARRILMAILILGIAGISTELWLLDHVEDVYQLIPMALNALAVLAAAILVWRPSAAAVRVFQGVMILMLISGAAGVWLHYQVNTEFQLEMDPQLSGMALFRKSIVAKAPPALAPGAMVQLGLIGLAFTFRHPASARRG